MASIALIALGRYDEALARARRLEAVTPRSAGPHLTTAAAHAHRGDLDAARQAAAEVLLRRPQLDDGLRLAGLPERPASSGRLPVIESRQ